MGNIGGGEILIVLLAALIFLGPSKLPEAARQIGKAMGEFRKVTTGFQRELRDAMNDNDDTSKRITNAPAAPLPAVDPVDAATIAAEAADAAAAEAAAATATDTETSATDTETSATGTEPSASDPAAETSSDR